MRPVSSLRAALSVVALVAGIGIAHAGPGGSKVVHPTVEGADLRRGGPGVVNRATTAAGITGSLYYRGAVSGVGVTVGPPKVYLVFWGNQWKTQGSDGNGNVTFSGDTLGAAPYLQNFYRGLGGAGDTWSNVMTYDCETVAGATSCPATARHVGFPSGTNGALAGVWYDPAGVISSNTTPTDADIAREALAAAQHFNNTSPGSNRNVQYVIVSPPGTHPGGFPVPAPNTWCAWHDWNGDTTMNGGAVAPGPGGDFAFTNLPYVADLKASCGQNYVNSTTGTLDGFSLVGGHEYSETITDQFPAGGWTDAKGYENADKCSWIGTNAAAGGAGNITLLTGQFPVQGQWMNTLNGCATTYPTAFSPSSPTNLITVTAPTGPVSVALGAAISPVTVSASGTTSSATYSFTATGLPTGLVMSTSGTISGTPTKAGSFTAWITAADANKAVGYGSIAFTVIGNTVTVTPPANQTSTKGLAIASVSASASTSGGALTFSWTPPVLPAGITASYSSNGSVVTFSGTPTTVQSAKAVTLTAKDSTGATGTASFNWTVLNTVVAVAPIAAQTTKQGAAVASVTATATDNNPALTSFTWTMTGQPTGATITGGVIGGTISATATKKTYTVTVTAKDANGATGKTTFSWTVN